MANACGLLAIPSTQLALQRAVCRAFGPFICMSCAIPCATRRGGRLLTDGPAWERTLQHLISRGRAIVRPSADQELAAAQGARPDGRNAGLVRVRPWGGARARPADRNKRAGAGRPGGRASGEKSAG